MGGRHHRRHALAPPAPPAQRVEGDGDVVVLLEQHAEKGIVATMSS